MIRVSEEIMTQAFVSKGEAYKQDVLSSSELRNGYYEFEDQDYMALKAKYRSLVSKAVSLVQTVTSRQASPEVVSARKEKCEQCLWFEPSQTQRGHYCRTCGCGDRLYALLENKWERSKAKCPIGEW